MKFFLIIFILLITYGCSFNPNSKIWTTTKIVKEENLRIQTITKKEDILDKELNVGLIIDLKKIETEFTSSTNLTNNVYSKYNGNLKNKSKYRYSKIKKFYQYEPEISFSDNNIIFFDNKGSILKFDQSSKLLWKKNYYSKPEIKNNPILFFGSDSNILVVEIGRAHV